MSLMKVNAEKESRVKNTSYVLDFQIDPNLCSVDICGTMGITKYTASSFYQVRSMSQKKTALEPNHSACMYVFKMCPFTAVMYVENYYYPFNI